MTAQTKRFITAGMYAFTSRLRNAWQDLFEEFLAIYDSELPVNAVIMYETDFRLLRNPDLLLGHTCGYPLIRYLINDCHPVSVPLFDADGCNGKYYSSHIIAGVNSNINHLADSFNSRVAINGYDSNSGMNVLRHAVSLLKPSSAFFSQVIESGSHLDSLSLVANGQADIAAIDCVSFAFIKDAYPELTEKVKSIGYCQATCGLPFVIPRSDAAKFNQQAITNALNIALSRMPRSDRECLHLRGFENVTLDDYQSIPELETQASQAGYPVLI